MDARKHGQYFDESPAVSSDPRTVRLVLPDVTLSLRTDRGVFSAERVDQGTKYLLLDGPAPTPPMTALADVGCGYGPIALTLAHRAPRATIWAIDVNERARELCHANAEAAGVGARVRVVSPEEVPSDLSLDAIWSNPPVRIGKSALHDLLLRWLPRLRTGGRALLVVQKHLGSDSLQRWLTEQGWPTTRVGSRSSYRLLEVQRPTGSSGAEQ